MSEEIELDAFRTVTAGRLPRYGDLAVTAWTRQATPWANPGSLRLHGRLQL